MTHKTAKTARHCVDKVMANPDPVRFEDGMWWFWEETWAFRHGSFNTELEARKALTEYCERELGED